MNKFFTVISIVLFNYSYSQKTTISSLTDVFAKDVCSCFSNRIKNDSGRINNWRKCFIQTLINRKKLVVKTAFYVYGDTSSATGKKISNEIMELVIPNLIYDCNSYYASIVEERRKVFSNLFTKNRDSLVKEVNDLNSNTSKRDLQFYKYRSHNYLCLKEFEKARIDLDSVKLLEKNSLYATYLNAEIAEYLEEYDEAIKFYDELEVRMKGGGYYKELAMMLKRKRNSE